MFTQALQNLMFEIGMLLAVVGKTCMAFPQCSIQDMGGFHKRRSKVKPNYFKKQRFSSSFLARVLAKALNLVFFFFFLPVSPKISLISPFFWF